MIKGAIFDVDGTLLDSMHIWEDAGEKYLLSVDRVPEQGLYKILFPMTLEESSVYLKDKYSLPCSTEEIKTAVLNIIENFYRFEVQTKPGVKEFLMELDKRGIPMTVATTSDRNLIEAAFKRLGISKYFKKIFTCSELETSKREPKIYNAAADYMGLNPRDTFVFEDVFYAIETSKAARFKTIAVEDYTSSSERDNIKSGSDYYMKDFRDFEGFWKYASCK